MDVFMIYREQYADSSQSAVEELTPIDFVKTEKEAYSFTKLFNLQLPHDLRDRMNHKFIVARITASAETISF